MTQAFNLFVYFSLPVVSDNSVQDESGNEGNLIKDVKSMALEVAAGSDVMYMDTADLSVHAPEENSQNKSNDQVFFGKTPTEGKNGCFDN